MEVSDGDAFSGQEIIEDYDEAAETEWRKKHKESVRKQKLKEAEERQQETKFDQDIENILDRYELLEEMAGELDNLKVDESDDILSKLISGEMGTTPEGGKRIAHENGDDFEVKSTYILQKYEKNQEEAPQEEESSSDGKKKKKQRRRVTFSNTEDVKVIIPAAEVEDAPTIKIKFYHSELKFQPDPPKENAPEHEPKFAHPGDFLKLISAVPTETKSILKSKGSTSKPKKKGVNFQGLDDTDEEFESFVRNQVTVWGENFH